MSFNDELHTLTLSDDGSYTAYSKEYDEHYHSTKDGALFESLKKHVIPAFELVHKESVDILDICYGLGFNTLATIWYYRQNRPDTKLNIYSPELDASLVKSLENFSYPKEFEKLKNIIITLSREGVYEDERLYVEIFLDDARKYVKKFTDKFDIVYQDAFSPSTNPVLWTKEYFSDIANAVKEGGILTTYSIAFKTRLALYENGFNIYINVGEEYRDATLASLSKLEGLKEVDMPHKISCNSTLHSLRDSEL
ncbi:tRNA (5-methylaminomethyl-2-thiouridine)(34)-methyltransferase MnmD [Sulfurimonas sp.]